MHTLLDKKPPEGKQCPMKTYARYAGLVLSILLAACGRVPEANAPKQDSAAPNAALPPPQAKLTLQWVENNVPPSMALGAAVSVHVKVKNTGDWPWPNNAAANPSKPDGTYAVRLGYRWAKADRTLLPENSFRGNLGASVPPGETASFTLEVTAPKQPGQYQLEIDLVLETVTWFSTKGNEKLIVPVTVQ